MRALATATSCHAPAHGRAAYERHCPETTLLYRTLQEHWLEFVGEIEDGGGELPAFVRDEFAAYLRCGILAHGFLRVRCTDCGHNRLVAFSCKRRGFCPSCLGRRMADTAAFCVDHLFPRVPVRQWVLSVPYRLRFRLAYAPRLASAVLRSFIAAVTSDLQRRARRRRIRGRIQAGSLTVVQRFGSIVMGTLGGFPNPPAKLRRRQSRPAPHALGLNIHFHSLVLDGVYARAPDGSLLFHPLPAPTDEDVARVARAVSRKVSRVLARQRPAAEEQASLLDELANASVQGLVATGPRRGCHVLRLGTGGDVAEASITGRRCADVAGFNVHANVRVRANDRDGLERLVKYLARPPIANDRLSELPDGRLALAFKQRWRDGTTHVVLSPHELVEKLIPLIPRPRAHLVRYHGILGPAAQDRASVVPRFVRPEFGRPAANREPRELDPSGIPRLGRLPWAVLLKRVFLVDVLECPKCKGRMKILAALTAPASVRRVLDHLGLPSEAPRLRAARPPPQLDLPRGREPSDGFYPDPPSPDW